MLRNMERKTQAEEESSAAFALLDFSSAKTFVPDVFTVPTVPDFVLVQVDSVTVFLKPNRFRFSLSLEVVLLRAVTDNDDHIAGYSEE